MKAIFSARPHRTSTPDALAVWFTQPWGMVTQFTAATTMTEAAAEFIIASYDELTRRCPDASRRFVFMHDWSLGSGYEPGARTRLVTWGRQIHQRVDRVVICMGKNTPALARMGLGVGAAAMAVIGMKLDVLYGVEAAAIAATHGLTPSS
jgi:hypothetical protein